MEIRKRRNRLVHLIGVVAAYASLFAYVHYRHGVDDPVYSSARYLRSTDAAQRLEGLLALKQLGTIPEPAIQAVLEAVNDVDPRVRGESMRTLANLLSSHRNDPEVEQARASFKAALLDPIPAVRHAAAIALTMIDPRSEATIPPLIEAVGDDDPMVRGEAITHLGRFAEQGNETTFRSLLSTLKDRDPSVKMRAIRLLAAPTVPPKFTATIAAAILPTLDDESAHVRAAAVVAVADLAHRTPLNIDGLIRAMTDPNPEVRALAVGAYYSDKTYPPAFFPAVIRAVSDPDPDVRIRACMTLLCVDNLNREGAIEALRLRLMDESEHVRKQAIDILWLIAER